VCVLTSTETARRFYLRVMRNKARLPPMAAQVQAIGWRGSSPLPRERVSAIYVLRRQLFAATAAVPHACDFRNGSRAKRLAASIFRPDTPKTRHRRCDLTLPICANKRHRAIHSVHGVGVAASLTHHNHHLPSGGARLADVHVNACDVRHRPGYKVPKPWIAYFLDLWNFKFADSASESCRKTTSVEVVVRLQRQPNAIGGHTIPDKFLTAASAAEPAFKNKKLHKNFYQPSSGKAQALQGKVRYD
jgi:hypothetical protein